MHKNEVVEVDHLKDRGSKFLGEHLYPDMSANSRSSFSQVGEINAGHMTLDHMERWNDMTRETKAGRISQPHQPGRLNYSSIELDRTSVPRHHKASAVALEVIRTFLF